MKKNDPKSRIKYDEICKSVRKFVRDYTKKLTVIFTRKFLKITKV